MFNSIQQLVLKLFKVPPEPQAPSGSASSIRTFRASKNYFKLQLLKWGIAQVSALIGIIAVLIFDFGSKLDPRIGTLIRIAEIFGFLALLMQIPVTLFLVRLDFDMRWYIVTDRSLRIREGVHQVREMTMTFANIQQIVVRQGPLQRLLGISDLQVRTAGGGGGGGYPHGDDEGKSMHIGYFRGVDNAEAIRDLIVERLRKWRDAGLGDPDDVHEEASESQVLPAIQGDLKAAAQEFLTEARSLKLAWIDREASKGR